MIFPPCPEPPASTRPTTPTTVSYTIQGDDDSYQPDVPKAIQRNFKPPFQDTLLKIYDLSKWPDNWNERGASAPNPRSVEHALNWLKEMYWDANSTSNPWREPHVVADMEGDVVLEWWHQARKITLYISPTSVEFVKVWGPNIFDEMEDGTVRHSGDRRALWNWLHNQ